MKKYITLFCLLFIVSCSSLDVLNGISPDNGAVHVGGTMAYGNQHRQVLDVYRPKQGGTHLPVLVFYYGGRWQMGDKNDYRWVAQQFTKAGYVVVIPDVRLYPEVKFPAFLNDAAQAFVWTHNNIARFGGDADRLYVMGHSAGAYNALMLALDPRYIIAAGGKPAWVKATVSLAGPADFLPFTDDDIKDIFSADNGHLQDTQPIHFASGHHAPILLLHGTADSAVKPKNTINLAAALRQAGNPVTVKFYPDIGHIGILLGLDGFKQKTAPSLADSIAFLKSQ